MSLIRMSPTRAALTNLKSLILVMASNRWSCTVWMTASVEPSGERAICSIEGKFPKAATGTAAGAGDPKNMHDTTIHRNGAEFEPLSMGHSSVRMAGISLLTFYTNIFYAAKRLQLAVGDGGPPTPVQRQQLAVVTAEAASAAVCTPAEVIVKVLHEVSFS